METAQRYSHVTQEDLNVLDLLSSPTPPSLAAHNFAHGSHQHTFSTHPTMHEQKRRPLATIAALRRPPIDPIILAASLQSGPHVTRHHFHHSFGADPRVKPPVSEQMPASQRRAKAMQQQQRDKEMRLEYAQQLQNTAGTSTSRMRPRAGSYASCDIDPPLDLDSVGASAAQAPPHAPEISVEVAPVPEVTAEELASYYASKQAPRSVRLKREQDAKRAAEESRESHSQAQAEIPSAKDLARPQLQKQPSRAAAELSAALIERQAAAASAAVAPQAPLTASSLAIISASSATAAVPTPRIGSIVRPPPLHVRCYARTRVPTPHGEVFCHLYRNNHDAKEHLALVVDPAQNDETSMLLGPDGRPVARPGMPPPLRSRTLDEVWGSHETEMERIVRGAYVGRLGPGFQMASEAGYSGSSSVEHRDEVEAPLVRIHSECYTGETIGSQRCDCGEQLDEAIRLISESGRPASAQGGQRSARGVVVYLRQEGRGIGLLDKLMAYNLQDMGHDTVAANILLGHLPDARKYDVASAILADLGIEQCRLLTNNPEKMEALEAEGVHVRERVAMVPRVWRCGPRKKSGKSRLHKKKKERRSRLTSAEGKGSLVVKDPHKSRRLAELAAQASGMSLEQSILSQPESRVDSEDDGHVPDHQLHDNEDNGSQSASDDDLSYESDSSRDSYVAQILRRSGATMVGAGVTRGPELEKYLRTKVERMGHMLTLPPEEVTGKDSESRAGGGQDGMRPTAVRQQTSTSIDTQPALEDEEEHGESEDDDQELIVL